eukprot:gb/GECH01013309.1/.p1 GENE.gb/GECH01013309.1/~~gb/GECH01013309.1/.p1  ORF type:complete len:291 (+),score=70.32 gb/GECH01013309.1/:1-873(+)
MFFDNIYFYLAAIPTALAGLLVWKQDLLLYLPYVPQHSREKFTWLPSRFNMPWEDVWLRTADNVDIHCWYIRQADPHVQFSAPTILYFHGNAGNISHRLQNVRDLYRLGYNIFLVSYRGYGLSRGAPSESGLQRDAEAALEYLSRQRRDIDGKKIFVFGRSLGGAVGIHLARKHQEKIAGLIIENTFTCIPDIIDHVLPFLRFFKWLSWNHWNSIQAVGHITKPILFLSGGQDELVPPQMMRQLYNRCYSPRKQLRVLEAGTHNETWQQPGYYTAIEEFIETHAPSTSFE